MGTQGFAPPEQYGFSQTTFRSDIYAVGVTLLWMATGGTDAHVDLAKVKSRALRNVIRRMTAFAPENRYQSAKAVYKALEGASRNKRSRRFIIPIAAAVMVIAGAYFTLTQLDSAEAGVTFSQEIIERAVRSSLGKTADEVITRDDLSKVESLYIANGEIAQNEDEFYAIPDMGELDQSLTNLKDLELLPNLKDLFLARENVVDLSPVAKLKNLKRMKVSNMPVSSLTAIEGLNELWFFALNATNVSDLSPIAKCQGMRWLALSPYNTYDYSFLAEMGELDYLNLMMVDPADSLKYLAGKRVKQIRLTCGVLKDFGDLSRIEGLEIVEVDGIPIFSLSGVENCKSMWRLIVKGSGLTDFTALLNAPALRRLEVDESLRDATALLTDSLEVLYV